MNISNSVSTAISNQATQLLKYKVNGETKYGYIMQIGETGFIALSCIPKGQYFSSLVLATTMLFVMIVIGVVFILFLIGKLSGNIVKPLLQLNDAAMEFANGMIQETAQMADVQMKNIDQIRDVIDDMSQVVQDNSAMAEETSATSEKLAAQSVTLNDLVQKFELN